MAIRCRSVAPSLDAVQFRHVPGHSPAQREGLRNFATGGDRLVETFGEVDGHFVLNLRLGPNDPFRGAGQRRKQPCGIAAIEQQASARPGIDRQDPAQ